MYLITYNTQNIQHSINLTPSRNSNNNKHTTKGSKIAKLNRNLTDLNVGWSFKRKDVTFDTYNDKGNVGHLRLVYL